MRLLPEKLCPAGFIRKKLKFMLTARQRFTNISRPLYIALTFYYESLPFLLPAFPVFESGLF